MSFNLLTVSFMNHLGSGAAALPKAQSMRACFIAMCTAVAFGTCGAAFQPRTAAKPEGLDSILECPRGSP